MSRIDKIISEMCPEGVEYKTLGELATEIYRGSGIKRSEVTENGIPCVRYGEIYTTYDIWFDTCVSHTDEKKIKNGKYFEYGDVLFAITGESVEDIAKSIVYVGHERCMAGGDIVVMKHNQEPKYLAYVLSTTDARLQKSKGKVKSKVVHSSVPAIKEISVPVPPLEVQREIVRVLDHFTLLSAELSAELKARKKQYEYYLDSFFKEQSDCLIPLNQVGKLTRGKRFVHADAVEEGVPCVHYGEIYTYYGTHANTVKSHIREELRDKMRYAHKGDVIIVGAGENNIDIGVGVSWEGEEDVAVHDACYTLVHDQNSRYISYYLRSHMYHEQIKKYVSSGKICAISAEGIGKAMIPLPSLKKQDEIVSILNRFETLCNDISEGIPAEIEARKKQYEYYRDKLLTFK